MTDIIKVKFPELRNCQDIEFTFDAASLKIFIEYFWEEKEMPVIISGDLIKEGYPVDWSNKCLKCGSSNCHRYTDCLQCFDCKHREKFPMTKVNYNLILKNGYLCRQHKQTKEIDWFHRFIFTEDLTHKEYLQVHHKDFNKKNNSKANLLLISEKLHKQIHSRDFFDKDIQSSYQDYCQFHNLDGSEIHWGEYLKKINKE